MHLHPRTSIVILTGAGLSAESGLATFRGQGGLWRTHRIEEVANPEAFARDPDQVHAFYNERRSQLDAVEPNAAHLALARLEREWPGEVLVLTQNVDDLHERAGTHNLVHLHGELRKLRCTACNTIHRWSGNASRATSCPDCSRTGTLRPQIVWFGEMPMEPGRTGMALMACGLFAVIGTSGQVEPAASFIDSIPPFAYTLELNLEETPISDRFFECRRGPATELVPAWVEQLLGNQPRASTPR